MDTIRWSDAQLNTQRQTGDPLADSVIDAILRDHDVSEINRLMAALVQNDDLPLASLPEVVRRYLEDSFVLPIWTDGAKIRRANALFNEYGPEIMLLLFTTSLPVLYAKQQGAPVLTITRHLSDITTFQRRIVETAQFLLDVTDQGAFTDSGRAIRTTQKVRLMHAAVRYYIQNDARWQADWQADWGVPINQSDLAGTMLSFSVTVTEGLQQAGIHLSQADKDAYLHLWLLVGHIMGVSDEMMPQDYAEAQALMQRWMARNHGPSEAGILLTRTLIDFLHERVPRSRFDSYTTNWMRFWLGDDLCDALAIPPRDGVMLIIQLQRVLWQLEHYVAVASPLFRWLGRIFNRRLLEALIHLERDGKEADFRIPDRLQAQWGLKPNSDTR